MARKIEVVVAFAFVVTGSKDVEKEAILGEGGPAERTGQLWAVVAELGGIEGREPVLMREGRAPTEVADGRRGVGDAQKCVNACGGDKAADRAAGGEGERTSLRENS
jgi:hypothetical protein